MSIWTHHTIIAIEAPGGLTHEIEVRATVKHQSTVATNPTTTITPNVLSRLDVKSSGGDWEPAPGWLFSRLGLDRDWLSELEKLTRDPIQERAA